MSMIGFTVRGIFQNKNMIPSKFNMLALLEDYIVNHLLLHIFQAPKLVFIKVFYFIIHYQLCQFYYV